MNKTIDQKPYWWIKTVEESLLALDEKPLLRAPHPFLWEEFSKALSTELGVNSLQITAEKTQWESQDDILSGVGENPHLLSVIVSPLSEVVYWAMDEEDLSKLTSLFLMKEKSTHSLSSSILQEGFYRFLLLQVLSCLNDKEPIKDFSLKISDQETLPAVDCLCTDVKISQGDEHLFGKLILTPDFRSAWNEHFASSKATPNPSLLSHMEVSLSLEIGHTELSQEEFHEISPGDFVLLDRCMVDPATHQGALTIKLGKTPLFQAKIKQNKIQLLDLANYYEDKSMKEEELAKDEHHHEEKKPHMEELDTEIVEVEVEAEESSSLGTTPITLTVEVAKVNMTLEKLLELQPGNFLELSVHPDQGVNLTVNGKKVGRAELVHLGEALGIRILELE